MSHRGPAPSRWRREVRTVIESSLDAVVTIDDQGKIVDWNTRAVETFGWEVDEVLGEELAALIIPESFREAHRAGMERFRKSGELPIAGQRLELPALRRDGSQLPVELSVAPIENDGQTLFLAYVRDISDWHREEEEQQRNVLEARIVGEAAFEVARASSYEDALKRILHTICEQIEWPLGHVWIPNDTGQYLVSSQIWYVRQGLDTKQLRSATARARFAKGRGVPGTIWDAVEPIWLADLTLEENFSRGPKALAAGLRSVFGFPVTSNDRVEAVVEFFHTGKQPRDEELLRMLKRVGRQVGELVHLRHYEHQQARLAAIVGSSYDAIIGKDPKGIITSWNAGAEHVYGYLEDEAIGDSISIILPDGQTSEEQEIVDAIASGQSLEQFRTTRRRKDGILIPVSLTVSPILDRKGRGRGLLDNRTRHLSDGCPREGVASRETNRNEGESHTQ